MPPRKPVPAERAEVSELREEIADLRAEMMELKQSIGVLTDVMDGIREELHWLTRNGLPSREEPVPPVPVLKEMARDPCDPKWGEKLIIARGHPDERPSDERSIRPAPESARDDPVPPFPSFEPGNAVVFEYDGAEEFGEIVSIDSARGEAVVMLIPSQEEVLVPLDDLTEVEPDPEEAEPQTVSAEPVERSAPGPPAAKAPPGKLFPDPGEQQRLF